MIRNFTLKLDAIKNDRYQVTPEGFLTCDANVTRAGVFDYKDDRGQTIRELRSPEEVFAPGIPCHALFDPGHLPASGRTARHRGQ